MKELMFDIETLDTKPSSVILSIGVITSENGKLSNPGCWFPDIQQQLDMGCTVSASTLRWWLNQGEGAKKVFDQPKQPIEVVMAEVAKYVTKSGKNIEPWCNGASFDMPIMEDKFRLVGLPIPWNFWTVRDMRTIKNLVDRDTLAKLQVEPKIAHDALEDAIAQAQTLNNILTHLGIKTHDQKRKAG